MGVLMEKALTQPGSYPLTINAVLLGANQKQNREPVMECAESDVSRALHMLQIKGCVKQAPPSSGARANRFQHQAAEMFHWDRREQAVMAELLLRGKQTAGELRSRAERMTPLPDLEAVHHVLHSLASAQTPYAEELPREPGRSANRWRHLRGESDIVGETGIVGENRADVRPPEEAAREVVSRASVHAKDTTDVEDCSRRLHALESTVSTLLERVARLEQNRTE